MPICLSRAALNNILSILGQMSVICIQGFEKGSDEHSFNELGFMKNRINAIVSLISTNISTTKSESIGFCFMRVKRFCNL